MYMYINVKYKLDARYKANMCKRLYKPMCINMYLSQSTSASCKFVYFANSCQYMSLIPCI